MVGAWSQSPEALKEKDVMNSDETPIVVGWHQPHGEEWRPIKAVRGSSMALMRLLIDQTDSGNLATHSLGVHPDGGPAEVLPWMLQAEVIPEPARVPPSEPYGLWTMPVGTPGAAWTAVI